MEAPGNVMSGKYSNGTKRVAIIPTTTRLTKTIIVVTGRFMEISVKLIISFPLKLLLLLYTFYGP